MRSHDGLHCETNSLSLRERARVRGKAVCNGQGLGALPGVELCFPSLRTVEVTGSSPARGFAERFFPLTPALSPRRGRTVRCAFANPERLDPSPRDMRCSPTLRERERGDWEIRNRFQAMFSRLSPLPSPLPARSSRGEGVGALVYPAVLSVCRGHEEIPQQPLPGGLASQTAGARRGGNG